MNYKYLKLILTTIVITVSARDLFEFIGLEERFSRWWNRMVSYGYEENIDYTPYQKYTL